MSNYSLPNPLLFSDGTKVENADQWKKIRKEQLLTEFSTEIYGQTPNRLPDVEYETLFVDSSAFDGMATLKQVRIHFVIGNKKSNVSILVYSPNSNKKTVPAFLGLNFNGNHTIDSNPQIGITDSWVPDHHEHVADERERGEFKSRWPIEEIIKHGYGLVTAYYGDLSPDCNQFDKGVRSLFSGKDQAQWGAIGVWAWGLSRILDYLETDPKIDEKRVAVIGHSRLGKTALWAAAQDTRFAMTISNSSGALGAALSRRNFGETVMSILGSFPWWFSENFNKYQNNVNALPVDQHELISLIAPRPVYVQVGEEDNWTDPFGQFLGAKNATSVFNLLGVDGLKTNKMPPVRQPNMEGKIGFHVREGGHDITLYDWKQYLKFADKYL